jgi:hypothetical protein
MRLKADLTLLFVSVLGVELLFFQRIFGEQGGVYYFNGLAFCLAHSFCFRSFENERQFLIGSSFGWA